MTSRALSERDVVWSAILERQAKWTPEDPTAVRLSPEDAVILYETAPLHALMSSALLRRQQQVPGGEVTYLIDRNVNYTNACTINCQFCSFYRPIGHDEVYTQTIDEISQRLSELEAIGGVRVLMQGGVNPDLPFSWYTDVLRELRVRHPSIDLDCFSPIEIQGMSEITGLSTVEVLRALKEAGMHGLPGGGAEMLVEGVRRDVSPKKGGPEQWIRIMREAQSLDLITSATNVFGFGEGALERVEHLVRVRDMQDEAIARGERPFTSFIAWPVQLGNQFIRSTEPRTEPCGTWCWTVGIPSSCGRCSSHARRGRSHPSIVAYDGRRCGADGSPWWGGRHRFHHDGRKRRFCIRDLENLGQRT